MDSEIESLKKNDTFDLVNVNPKQKVLGGKGYITSKITMDSHFSKQDLLHKDFAKSKILIIMKRFRLLPD